MIIDKQRELFLLLLAEMNNMRKVTMGMSRTVDISIFGCLLIIANLTPANQVRPVICPKIGEAPRKVFLTIRPSEGSNKRVNVSPNSWL